MLYATKNILLETSLKYKSNDMTLISYIYILYFMEKIGGQFFLNYMQALWTMTEGVRSFDSLDICGVGTALSP